MNTLRTTFFLTVAVSALLAPACMSTDVPIGSDSQNDGSDHQNDGSDTQNDGSDTQIDPCACLAAYAGDSMDTDALRKLQGEGLDRCLRGDGDPSALEEAAACLPFWAGTDARTGKGVEVYYECSDVCPNYGFVDIRYVGVEDETACCAMGGFVWMGFFGYVACSPIEIEGRPWDCSAP